MPFHTTCFEVYKYVSRDKLGGKIEVRQLMEWWASCESDKIPEHPDVGRNLEQWWQHCVSSRILRKYYLFSELCNPAMYSDRDGEKSVNLRIVKD